MGYYRAGFDVVGIDLEDHSDDYPFDFYQDDAFEFVKEHGHEFDVIHASPPCQAFSTASGKAKKHHGASYPDLITRARSVLMASGKPYVIENIPAAPLHDPVQLCGSSFGLNLRRHRMFESNMDIRGKECNHSWQTPRFQSLDSRMVKSGRLATVVGVHGNINYSGEFPLRCSAMGINWMTNASLVEAIPPAYTEFIGSQIFSYLEASNGNGGN